MSYCLDSWTSFLRAAGYAGGVQGVAGRYVSQGAADCLPSWPNQPPIPLFSWLQWVQSITWRPVRCQWCSDRRSPAASAPVYSGWALSRAGTTAAMCGHQEVWHPWNVKVVALSTQSHISFNFPSPGPSPLFQDKCSSILKPGMPEVCLCGSPLLLVQFVSFSRQQMLVGALPLSLHSGVVCQQHLLLHIYRNLLICNRADILLCLLHHCVCLNDGLRMSCCHVRGRVGPKNCLHLLIFSHPAMGYLALTRRRQNSCSSAQNKCFSFLN